MWVGGYTQFKISTWREKKLEFLQLFMSKFQYICIQKSISLQSQSRKKNVNLILFFKYSLKLKTEIEGNYI